MFHRGLRRLCRIIAVIAPVAPSSCAENLYFCLMYDGRSVLATSPRPIFTRVGTNVSDFENA